jgi:PAS domain S-box-containing protein
VAADAEAERLRRRVERERRAREEAESIAEAMVAQLNRTVASLAEAQAIAHLGSWEWDIAADRVSWSDEMHRIWGLRPGDLGASYESYLASIHPDDRARADAAVRQAVQDRQPFAFEHRVVRPDGSVLLVAGNGRVECDAGGTPIRMSGTAQDITALRQAEALRRAEHDRVQEMGRLKEANRFKTQFINTAAHELLTPLTPLRSLVRVMGRDPVLQQAPKFSHQLEVIARNLERLTRLTQDLLDASRLEGGRLGLRRAPVNLSDLCATVLESFRTEAQAKGIRLESRLAPDVAGTGDADRLAQVVTNLVSNALKFTPSPGTVTVRTRWEGGQGVLSVTDTGIGIDPEFLPSLYLAFSRAHLPSDQVQPGTGLGLFVTKGLVDLHGGTITCDSPGKGRGTTFTVALPLR